jgi:hypothetical protein
VALASDDVVCSHDVAAFSINRLSHTHGTPVEWRHTLGPFALTAEFSPATASFTPKRVSRQAGFWSMLENVL